MKYRIEKDSMGEIKVPETAYWAAQTGRAIENFQISNMTMPFEFIQAVSIVKLSAAKANASLGILDNVKSDAIIKASLEIIDGKFQDQFPIDVFQTGSGTSTNMNLNEVTANRACELQGGKKGDKNLCHPNDDVNKGQSSNDVIPTAIHISTAISVYKHMIPALNTLVTSLENKEKEFSDIIKIGRTHLMDAVPITLGQEFSGYKQQIINNIERIKSAHKDLLELPLGGTALGTGLNTHEDFAKTAIKNIAEHTGLAFTPATNLFESIAAKDAIVYFSGVLNTLATSLMKIANDLRLLSSGPRCGLAEISLPSLQPGSSIMPGKVNPVIPESVIQVAAQVMGNHQTITIAGASGLLDLNVMMPIIAFNILQSVHLLSNVSIHLAEKCIDDIKANKERCADIVEWSMALITPLAIKIGYDEAASIAYEAYNSNKTVKSLVKEKGLLSEDELDAVFDPRNMV